MMLDEIIYHQWDKTSISKEYGAFTTSSVLILRNRTTNGWELFVRWKGPVGTAHNNQFLDARQYEFHYASGETQYIPDNVISENLLSQVDN